jgi:hypothetical protein
MTKIAGSGSESRSITQRHGSADPDPDSYHNCQWIRRATHCFLLALQVKMNVSILAFAEINTVTLAITVDFILLMKWNDPRLVFNNLLESVDLNSLSEQNMNQLWTPSLSFSNGRQAEGTVVDSGTLSHVQRAGKRLPDDFSAAIEAQRFYGKDSPIIMEREYFVTFSCYFKLDMYPFDTQVRKRLNSKTVNFSFLLLCL